MLDDSFQYTAPTVVPSIPVSPQRPDGLRVTVSLTVKAITSQRAKMRVWCHLVTQSFVVSLLIYG